ncbi:MAG TPA: hypothetical protein VGI39_07910 [Polyangiaceae bacterium]|jgi:hypothetical protein
MRRLARAALFASSLTVFAPGSAFAQDASNQAAAQALFEQARQLMADGKFADACPKLAESQRLDPGAGTLLNLGHCYEKNGQTASAWVTFKDAAAAADLKHRADWSQRARERAHQLEPILSKLTIDVPADARALGVQVRRDGVEVGNAEFGVPIPVDPGEHALEAVAPAKKRWTTKVTVRPKGDVAHVVVPTLEDEPGPSTAATTPAPVTSPAAASTGSAGTSAPLAATTGMESSSSSSSGSGLRTAGLVVGGVGIAGLIVGGIFGGVALSKNSASKNDCPSSPCPATSTGQQGYQENSDASSAATISTASMIGGGVLVAAGAAMFLLAPKSHSTTGVRVMPAVGANELGLRVGGAW